MKKNQRAVTANRLPEKARPSWKFERNIKRLVGIAHCPVINTSADVAAVFSEMALLDREVMVSGAVDAKKRLVYWSILALGRNDRLVMRTADAFLGAIRMRAHGIFLVHNHPSGSLAISPEDLALTKNVAASGRLLGYPLLDHVVVTREGHRSVLELLKRKARKHGSDHSRAVLEAASGTRGA